jgi:tRNA G18 (ribose-2'-O)-methylase SpoU
MIVILYNIRSLYNVGSIFRTADAAGFSKIYLCGITPSPLDRFGKLRPQLSKVALGAEKYIEWEKVKSISKLIDKLKNPPTGGGYKVFSVEQDKKSIPYNKIKITKKDKIALIVGNETKGLPKSILDKSDKIIEIPMKGAVVRQAHHPRRTGRGKESLNVSVAFGIVAFSLQK